MPYIVLIYFMMFSLCINQTPSLHDKVRQTASNASPFGDVSVEVAFQVFLAPADHDVWQGRPQTVEGARRHAEIICGLSAGKYHRRGVTGDTCIVTWFSHRRLLFSSARGGRRRLLRNPHCARRRNRFGATPLRRPVGPGASPELPIRRRRPVARKGRGADPDQSSLWIVFYLQ